MRDLLLLLVVLCFAPACAGLDAKSELERKLDLQFRKYQMARELVLSRAQQTERPLPERAVSRDQWEQTLALTGADAWSASDLKLLEEDQARRIAKAKSEAVQSSVIDLETVRRKKLVGEFCAEIPKGGMLHFHPWGALDRKTASELLQQKNPFLQIAEKLKEIQNSAGNSILYSDEKEWLASLPERARYLGLRSDEQTKFRGFLFLPDGKHPFSRFNAVFHFIDTAIVDEDALRALVKSFAQRAAREGVSYIEMSSGTSETFLRLVSEIEAETGVMMRVHQSFRRTDPIAAIDERWKKLLARPSSRYVVGIDILDDEGSGPALEKAQLLYAEALLDGRFHRTMHAGELGDGRNTRDAMILGAERLGHGVNLAKDVVALEYGARTREPVEINISSNLCLTDVVDVEHHPFLKYLRLGLPVSLSTDDEGIFDTDINHECELAVAKTDIAYSELKAMAFNSLTTSFASGEDKKSLLGALSARFERFEVSWKSRQTYQP